MSNEHVDPGRLLAIQRQPEMCPHAKALSLGSGIQAKLLADSRVRSVGGDNQSGAIQIAAGAHPDYAAIFTVNAFDGCVDVCPDASSGGCCLKQNAIQAQTTLSAPDNGNVARWWESSLSDLLAKMIPHAVERHTPDGFRYAQLFQYAHPGWHDPLAACFLSREVSALEQFNIDSLATQQDRQRRSRDSASNNENISRHQASRLQVCAACISSPEHKRIISTPKPNRKAAGLSRQARRLRWAKTSSCQTIVVLRSVFHRNSSQPAMHFRNRHGRMEVWEVDHTSCGHVTKHTQLRSAPRSSFFVFFAGSNEASVPSRLCLLPHCGAQLDFGPCAPMWFLLN